LAINSSAKTGFDGLSIIILLSLIVVGWLMVYAAMYDGQNKFTFLDISTEMGQTDHFFGFSAFSLWSIHVN
jgi:hypothetical protein